MIVDSVQDLAYAVNHQFKLGLTARPWNLYSPSTTLWWLVPSTEWPAYRHGKYAFFAMNEAPGRDFSLGSAGARTSDSSIFAGLNIEKGYGSVAAIVNPLLKRKTAQIIGPDWLWFEVMKSGSATFDQRLREVSAGSRLVLYLSSSYVHDRDDDTKHPHDIVKFECGPNGFLSVIHNRFPVGVLAGSEQCQNFVELSERLQMIDDYHWVDIYAGTHVEPSDVDLDRLYRHVLKKFRSWVF